MRLILSQAEMRSMKVESHRHFITASSTNDVCMELLRESGGGVLVTAGAQSGGRGRMGRPWFSPPGGLYFSLGVRGCDPFSFPLIVPASVCSSIRSLGAHARIRWPNDILAKGRGRGPERKLAGVLIDAKGPFCAVGVGVNVKGSRTGFPPELRHIAVTLEDIGIDAEPKSLMIDIIKNIRRRQGSEQQDLVTEFASMCGTVGRKVRVEMTADRIISGRAVGLTGDGFLLVRTEDGEAVVDCCARLEEL
jgi:BirA family biotin operon repressor/biotin-[acetyl-CoA-carboxylase] ligase